MALWAKAQQLPPELVQQVTAIYGEHFPLEVRHVMANFIERHMWNEVTPGQPEQEAYAAEAVGALLQEMQKKAECMTTNDMFLTRMALLTAAERFQDKYNTSPVALYKHIQHCLYTEMQLVNGADALQPQPMACETKYSEIITTLDSVRKSVSEAIEDLRKMEAEQESFALQYHECTKHKAHMQTLAGKPMSQERRDKEVHLQSKIDRLESSLSIMVSGLFQAHLNLVDKLEKNIASLNMLQSRVLDDELISWKREQQLSGNGAVLTQSLNTIQEWCEHLADLIWQTRQQVKEADRVKQKLPFIAATGVSDKLPQADKQVTRLLTTLVTSTFVIEKQPPQVMKTNTRFTSTVRLLVGGQLNVFMTPPQVKVIIISESQAQALVKNEKTGGGSGGKQPTEMCGEILNNTGCMEYQPSTRQLSVSFRNMQLRKIKRAEKKGTESVMDEKLTLLFQSQFNVGGGELVFHVWTLSLPVVVIVHGNQEPHGWATVTWDNAFSAPGRIPFVVPDKVSWRQMADTLNLKFNYSTGHPLSEENLRFLAEKVFRTPNGVSSNDLHMTMVTWSQFCKEPLQDRNFTFWEWFYMVMKVTREHLRGPWGDGLIVGFIRKKQAEDMLAACPVGTFLLRFSDSEPGGVTIAWVGESQRGTGQPEVFSLQPFSSRDLQLRALGDRIADLAQLTCLYPDIPKDQAFGKYYSPPDKEPTSKSGYVKPVLVTHLPGWSAAYGSTPHHAASPFYNSPDSQRDTPSVHSSYAATPMPCYAATPASNDMEYELSQQVDSFDEYEFEQLAAFDMGAPDASSAAHAAMLAALLPGAGLQRPPQ